MSKTKFAAAKELIDEKKYDEARAILRTIDHPTAQIWLDKLDSIAPAEPKSFASKLVPQPTNTKSSKKAGKGIYKFTRGCLVVFAVLLVIYIITPKTSAPPAKSDPTFTEVERAAIASTSTAESIVFNATATVVALTPPTVTPTLTLSPTITETPIPSATPTETATPTPTITPLPTQAPFGSHENPYPVGAPGTIRDGRLVVNQFARSQTAAVKAMNMFNSDPPVGGEYAIANVTFYCDLPASKTCTVTFIDLELSGKLGSINKHEIMTVLDNSFQGEVFGGGQKTGNVAFIINSSDSDFTISVSDLGDRVFFRTK